MYAHDRRSNLNFQSYLFSLLTQQCSFHVFHSSFHHCSINTRTGEWVRGVMAGVGSEKKSSPIAFLDVCYRATQRDAFHYADDSSIPIFPSDDFYFGRSPSWSVSFLSMLMVAQLTIAVNSYVTRIISSRISTFTFTASSLRRTMLRAYLRLSMLKICPPTARS